MANEGSTKPTYSALIKCSCDPMKPTEHCEWCLGMAARRTLPLLEAELARVRGLLQEVAEALNLPPETLDIASCNHIAHVAKQARENAALYFQKWTEVRGLLQRYREIYPNIGQLLDGWHADGTVWSKWDEEVRQQVAELAAQVEDEMTNKRTPMFCMDCKKELYPQEVCECPGEAVDSAVSATNGNGKTADKLQRQWISVEERLPSYKEVVQVWLEGRETGVPRFATGQRLRTDESGDVWRCYWANHVYGHGEVTHWMPLPVPPNSETTVPPGGRSTPRTTDGQPGATDKSVEYSSQNPTFPQSSSLVSQGAESADIGKLDTADKSWKVNRVDETQRMIDSAAQWSEEQGKEICVCGDIRNHHAFGSGFSTRNPEKCSKFQKVSAETGGEKA